MKIFTLFAAPLLLTAQGYILVINHSNGQKTEIPTEEITDMVFQPQSTPDPGRLATPNVTATKEKPDSYRLTWTKVDGASYYGWKTDDDAKLLTTTGLQCGVSGLTVGKHEVRLWAYPGEGSGYQESEPCVVSLTADLIMRTNVTAKDKTSVTVALSVNTTEPCTVGIVPASVTGASAQITYVKENAASQRDTFTGTPEKAHNVTFTGLTPNTEYNIVAFLSNATDQVFATNVHTEMDLKPGDRGSVFPAGVSAEGGWVDVDKVGPLSPYGWTGQDNLMCWACTVSGMIQWWLNDYKAKTGHDFETVYPIPTESKCYSTPIMDLYVDYYIHTGGTMFSPIKWFFTPVDYNTYMDGEKLLNESLPYWKGGFGGMTEEEAQSLMVVNEKSSNGYIIPQYEFNQMFDIKGLSTNEAIKVFSQRIIDALRQGPLALSLAGNIGGNVHGVSCWGADYEVLADGSFKVNELYISENDPLAGNVKNGMNKGIITYEGDYVKVEMPTTSGKKNLNLFFGIRGWQGN